MKIAKSARINLRGRMLLGHERYAHSSYECQIRLDEGAVWDVNGFFLLHFGATVEIYKNAHLTTGDTVFLNTGSLIACNKKITIGDYVSAARMVFIFDSDFHPRYNSDGKRANADKEVIIEDHVWIGIKSTIMKGTHIGTGAVIAANSLVSGHVPPHSMVASTPSRPVLKNISWKRW